MQSRSFTSFIRVWLAALALVVMTTAAAYATELPVVVDRGDVVVRAARGLDSEARVLADRAAETLPRIAEDLQDLPRPRTIEIRLVRDAAELTSVSPPGHGAPRWAAGVAFPNEGVLALALRRGSQLHDTGKTLDHELAHLLLGAAVRNAPRWLHEGFAWQHAQDLGMDRVETLAGMAWFGNIATLDALESGFPAEEAPASRAYAQSYDFVGFLAHRGRWSDADDDGDRWPFRYFLRAMAQGKSVDAAAHEAYGVGIEDLYDEWRADLVRRYLLVPAGVFASGLWLIAAVLLVLAWRRRRRMAKVRLAQMGAEEAARARMFEVEEQPEAPPEDDSGDPLRDPPPPRWMN